MKRFVNVLFMVLCVAFVANAQNFEKMFQDTEVNSELGVNWATLTGKTVTLTVNGKDFQFPTAKFSSGKKGVIVVKGKQNFLYFAESSFDTDGKQKPLATVENYPVFESHTGKYFQLRLSNSNGLPYAKWANKVSSEQ